MDAPQIGRVVILVAEPGGGKTAFTEALRTRWQAHLFTAFRFLTSKAATSKVATDDLVIVDGLDEVARKRWGDGVARVLERLDALGCPNVLITCRSIEWDGAQYSSWIRDIYSENPAVIHFAPFSTEEQIDLVRIFDPDIDAQRFVAEAQRRDLGEMLGNPESLRLLLSSVAGGIWPKTRTELFDRATYHATQETNTRRQSTERIGGQRLVEAAGEIFASALLSGLDGVELAKRDVAGFQFLGDFEGNDQGSRRASLDTRLFRSYVDTSLVPAHRMVAEYLGARWLAERLHAHQISDRRLNAVIAPDEIVRTDLRGLHAWLASLEPADFRRRAIVRDPYGVLRYGDPTGFLVSEKLQLLRQLRKLAEDDPYFRAAEGWTRPLIAGFFDTQMRDDVLAIITGSNRNYHLTTLILAAMRGSEFARLLAPDLLEIASDESRPYGERSDAVAALQNSSEFDLSDFIKFLRKRRTEDSARLALQIISNSKGADFDTALIGDTLADAMLLNTSKRDADLSTFDYAVVRAISNSILDPVLDRLSERMAFMCSGRRRYRCNCLRALSPTVVRLVERRFQECEQPPAVDQLWRWIHSTYRPQPNYPSTETATAALASNVLLRRGIQERALRNRNTEKNATMALWHLRDLLNGLHPTGPDIAYHMKQAVAGSLSQECIKLWTDLARWGASDDDVRAAAQEQAAVHSELAEQWADITRPSKPTYSDLRFLALERRRKRETEANRRSRLERFWAVREQVERGEHDGWLIDIARAYLGHFLDIGGDTPDVRLAELLGEEQVNHAISGLCAALRRNDLPTLDTIAATASKGKYMSFELVICAGVLAHSKKGGDVAELPHVVLEAARASSYFISAFDKEGSISQELESVVFASKDKIENFARGLFEPQILSGNTRISELDLLYSDDRFSFCAGRLALEWLEERPDMSRSVQFQLFETAVTFGDKTRLTSLVRQRCAQLDQAERNGSLERLDPQERTIWIPAAFLLDFDRHRSMIGGFAEETRNRLWQFQRVAAHDGLFRRNNKELDWPRLGIAQNRFLIETFAPHWPKVAHPKDGFRGDQDPWDAHETLRKCAQEIGSSRNASAGEVLNALIDNPALLHLRDELLHLRASWRRRQRDATLEVPSFSEVQRIFVGGAPKSVPDLQAMTMDALSWLQEDIRDGDTKGWLRFWNADKPNNENDCRDHMLDRIRPKFEPVDVQLRPEGKMPNDKRTDILASLILVGEIHDLPIEIKCQWHKDIWTAAVAQLNERYARYKNARGRGVYLVLWFGSVPRKKLKARGDGKGLPKSPKELREMLYADLPENLKGRIDMYVLDVARPIGT